MISADLTWILSRTAGGISRDALLLTEALMDAGLLSDRAIVRRWLAPGRVTTPGSPLDLAEYLDTQTPDAVNRLPKRVQRAIDAANRVVGRGDAIDQLASRYSPDVGRLLRRFSEVQPVWPPQSVVADGFSANRVSSFRSHHGEPVLGFDVVAPHSTGGLFRLHDAIPELFSWMVNPRHAKMHQAALRFAVKSGRVLAVSSAAVEQTARALGQDFAPLAVIPNVVPPRQPLEVDQFLAEIPAFVASGNPKDSALLAESLARREDLVIVVTVAPLEPKKDMATFYRAILEANQRARGRFLALSVSGEGWGDGIERKLKLAAEASGSYVMLRGVPQPLLEALYDVSDVVVSTSLVEGFGRPVVEGLSHGAKVVATAIPAHKESLGSNATFIESGDFRALADVIVRSEKLSGIERAVAIERAEPTLARFRPAEVAAQFRNLILP